MTHMYELARGPWDSETGRMLFLRAERLDDGRRTFRLLPGEPLETSFGLDLYRGLFEGIPENRRSG